MRIVALEEHFTVPSLLQDIPQSAIANRGYFTGGKFATGKMSPMALLPDIGEQRLALMDEAGISMQVLSTVGPGPDLVPGAAGIDMARRINDTLAEAVARHPKRFAGFATLPVLSPAASAIELARCVKDLKMKGTMIHGTTEGRFLDDAVHDELLAAAVELDVPIYIHPNVPTLDLHKAYYAGLPEGADRLLGLTGWGWHAEVGLHVLRLAVSGTFDKYPTLKIVIGHMGELLPMMLARIDDRAAIEGFQLKRPPSRAVIDQVWVTTSGFFTLPPFIAALETFGIDRMMFSVDYPYATNERARKFLDEIDLPPADMIKFCSGNADALLKLQA